MFGFRSRGRQIASRVEWLETLSTHCGVGLWDAVFHDGDALHPDDAPGTFEAFGNTCKSGVGTTSPTG